MTSKLKIKQDSHWLNYWQSYNNIHRTQSQAEQSDKYRKKLNGSFFNIELLHKFKFFTSSFLSTPCNSMALPSALAPAWNLLLRPDVVPAGLSTGLPLVAVASLPPCPSSIAGHSSGVPTGVLIPVGPVGPLLAGFSSEVPGVPLLGGAILLVPPLVGSTTTTNPITVSDLSQSSLGDTENNKLNSVKLGGCMRLLTFKTKRTVTLHTR